MGIFWNFLIYFKSRKSITASALRHADLSRSTDPVQVKPDAWVPHVSVIRQEQRLTSGARSKLTGPVKPDSLGPLELI